MKQQKSSPSKTIFRRRRRGMRLLMILLSVSLIYFVFCLPSALFDRPHSTILYSKENILMSGIIADDGQWRFPARDTVPTKFKEALLLFEDQHFYDHSGIYLPSLLRAITQNIRQQKVVSGASTITMQTIRLSRENPPRTILEKVFEMIKALRLEWRYNKEDILAMYASNAPYGGNVVGLDAAAWRYFGRNPEQLSWAESATLAVLPNAPALIFPGKNQEKLWIKRNALLQKLHAAGKFDEVTLSLAMSEPLPQKPFPLPQTASHLLTTLNKQEGKGKRHQTTIELNLQAQGNAIVQQHIAQLESNLVNNAAVMVVEVKTGDVVMYIGNATDPLNRYSNMVDVIQAPRSTGSILKPFLYAAMLKDGLILPRTLIADIPMQFDGFSPQNYSETFDGAVPASLALSRSLNIPAVVMLRDYGYSRFYHLLKKIGQTHFTQPADHYGLSLILGGGESSLWDITHAYAGMSRTLVAYGETQGKYFEDEYTKRYVTQHAPVNDNEEKFPPYDAGSIYCTYQALLEVNRPETELGWEAYSSAAPIAWKTGTSFGNRDAWAVGTTPEYVVGVWVGNADGQGRPDLTGLTAAAPLLFDIFSILNHRSWFAPPFDDLEKIPVCKESGMRIGKYCALADTVWVPRAGLQTTACSYHQHIFTTPDGVYRITAECSDGQEMTSQNWFVLPPVQEYYYKTRHPNYLELPAFSPLCQNELSTPIGLIYPKGDAKIYIPKNLTGEYEKVVLQATHRNADAILYWHLDGAYLGETKFIHHLEMHPTAGKHVLTIVDQNGQSLIRNLEVMER